MRQVANRGWILSLGVLTIALIVTFCSHADNPVVPGVSLRAPNVPAFTKALPHARHDLGWVGDMHNQAMRELWTNRNIWNSHGRGTPAARRCAALSSLITEYGALIAQRLSIASSQMQSIEQFTLSKQHCSGATPMMLWPVSAREEPSGHLALDDTATGAYQNYVGALGDAINNASNPDEVASNMDGVLASATDLGDGDSEILETIASVGLSSSYQWYDEEQSGQLQTSIDSIREYETSIFIMSPPSFWGGLGWSDLLGAVVGAATVCEWTAGACAFVPATMMGAALLGAIGGSGSYLIGIAET